MNYPRKELWDLYDSEGRPLERTVVRGNSLKPGEYHQVVQIWVRNGNGEFLVQKRAAGLASLPGIWATTAGSVIAGEGPRAGAARELREELGIRVSEAELEMVLRERKGNSLSTAWMLERDMEDTELELQKEEVSAVMWASPEAIARMVRKGAFHDYGAVYFHRIFEHACQSKESTQPECSSEPSPESLPFPPKRLSFGDIALRFSLIVPGDSSRGFVPYYHFRILTTDARDVGHINFRVGETEHVRYYAGHIGFQVSESNRGNGFAGVACRALAPFLRSFYEAVTITCDPDNPASRRTIEKLGASFIDEVTVPPHDPHYDRGSRTKRRYEWRP